METKVDRVKHAILYGRLRHAWILGLIAVIYIWIFAPLQIDKMILVGGKIFIGAIIGVGLFLSVSRYFWDNDDSAHKSKDWMWGCLFLMAVGMYCMSQAV